MDRLHLRAIKCPGCAARMAYTSGAATVTCEYCQLVSEVINPAKRAPPQRAPVHPPPRHAPRRPPPQVQPKVRVGAVFGALALVLTLGASIAATVYTVSNEVSSALPTPNAGAGQEVASQADQDARQDQANAKGAKAKDKKQGGHKAGKKGAKKGGKKGGKKPDVYKIAPLVKPIIKECSPRDLNAPGHPVWYSASITMSVGGGGFKKIKVRASTSSSKNLEKLHFKSDRSREVTQADLDQRTQQVASCMKKKIASLKIPASTGQKNAAGKVRFSIGRDGVPYGIK